jgi:hypothetical protein
MQNLAFVLKSLALTNTQTLIKLIVHNQAKAKNYIKFIPINAAKQKSILKLSMLFLY